MAEAPYLMGIDLGTGGVRVGLFDREGSPVVFRAVEWGDPAPSINTVRGNYYDDRDEGGFPVSLYVAVGVEDLLDTIPQRVLDLGVAVGGLARDAADELGLEAGTAVAEGGIDAHVAIPTAAAEMVHVERTIEPDQDRHERYGFLMERYTELYPQVKDVMHEIALHVAGRRDP